MAEIDREKVIEILSRHKTMTFGDKLYDGIQFDLGDVVALLKEQEETKTIICQKCGDEIEIKWSLLIKPDMEAITQLNTQNCVG